MVAGGERLAGAAFRPADPDLSGYVILDFASFEGWHEEEEPIVGHPRDPFHRIDILRGSRHVRIELDGVLLAESQEPTLLFETHLPVRFYLPRADLVLEAAPEPKAHGLRVQGRGEPLVVRPAGRRRHRLELRGSARGGGPGRGPRGVLRRGGRRGARRRAARAPAHPVVEGGELNAGAAGSSWRRSRSCPSRAWWPSSPRAPRTRGWDGFFVWDHVRVPRAGARGGRPVDHPGRDRGGHRAA